MKRGFTLIETVIYLALFSIVITGIVVCAYSLLENAARNQSKAMLQEEKDFLLAKIDFALESANPGAAVTPAANTSSASLSVTSYGGTASAISRSGGNMFLNGVALNNSNVTISNLLFIHTYAGGSNPDSIEAGFTISQRSSNGMTISQIASTTRYLRK